MLYNIISYMIIYKILYSIKILLGFIKSDFVLSNLILSDVSNELLNYKCVSET